MAIVLPWSRVRAGVGSKESTWETPPDMVRKMTDRARGAQCAALGASGSRNAAVPDDVSAARSSSETIPDASSVPATLERMKQRRDRPVDSRIMSRLQPASLPLPGTPGRGNRLLVYVQHLIAAEERAGVG